MTFWPFNKKSDEEEITKLRKIVYFDEHSAGDLLNIDDNGSTKEFIKKNSEIYSKFFVLLDAKLSLLLLIVAFCAFVSQLLIGANLISNLLVGSGIFAGALVIGIHKVRSHSQVITTQIQSTILNRFIEKKLEEHTPKKVEIEENSFAFIKYYDWAFRLIDMDTKGIDISKFGEVMKDVKGYHELIAYSDNDKKEKIFRLNADSFRNNYKLTDLIQMDLVYYGIQVGEMPLSKVRFENILNPKTTGKPPTNGTEGYDTRDDEPEKDSNNKKLPVIDIILVGVKE